MTRAVGSAAIQLALINIPIKLHKANRDAALHFNTVHAICHSPIKQKKWCPVCNKEVPAEELNKGFALSKEKMVEFSENEIDAIAVQESKLITVEKVVETSELPITALDTIYYLQPEKYGEHVYILIAQALATRKQALIGRLVMRSKEHLVAIQAYEGGLMLSTIHWHDELHSIQPLLPAAQAIPEQELQLAATLLDRYRKPLQLETFQDTYREKVTSMIEKRAKGEAITVPEIRIQAEPPKDIMAELQRSLAISTGAEQIKTVAQP
jgi:DNA end-binding protein Ku